MDLKLLHIWMIGWMVRMKNYGKPRSFCESTKYNFVKITVAHCDFNNLIQTYTIFCGVWRQYISLTDPYPIYCPLSHDQHVQWQDNLPNSRISFIQLTLLRIKVPSYNIIKKERPANVFVTLHVSNQQINKFDLPVLKMYKKWMFK